MKKMAKVFKEFIKEKATEKIQVLITDIKSKVISTINENGIHEIILDKLNREFNQIESNCHERNFGLLRKKERKFLKKNIANYFLKSDQFRKILNQDKEIISQRVACVFLYIRNSLFFLFSQTKNPGEYTLLKRLSLQKSLEIERNTEIAKILEKAIDNSINVKEEELNAEIEKLSKVNLDIDNQIQMLFEKILEFYEDVNRQKNLVIEIVELLIRYEHLRSSESLSNIYIRKMQLPHDASEIGSSGSSISTAYDLIKEKYNSKKLKQPLLDFPTEHGFVLSKKVERLPNVDFIRKHQKKYIEDGKLHKESLSRQRKICHFREGKPFSFETFECCLKFGVDEQEQNAILIEYASYLFSQQLISHGIPESDVFELDGNLLTLATTIVKGKIEEKHIKNPKELNLDEESFADFFFFTLIIAPGDLRYQNCGLEESNGKNRFSIYDNEHNFQEVKDQSGMVRKGLIFLLGENLIQPITDVNNFILGLEYYMNHAVNKNSISRYLLIRPEQMLKKWVESLHEKLKTLTIKKYPFSYQMVKRILERMGVLRLILSEIDLNLITDHGVTYKDVLEHFNKALSVSYKVGTTSSLRRKSVSNKQIVVSDENLLPDVISKLEIISKVYNDSECVPGHAKFSIEKFNELPPHHQSSCILKGNKEANIDAEDLNERQRRLIDDLAKVKYKQLYTFQIYGNKAITTEKLDLILTNIEKQDQKLKKLSLSHCCIVDSDLPGIIQLCNHLNVEILDLSGTQITDISTKKYLTLFGRTAATFVALKELLVVGCNDLSQIAIKAKNLSKLDITNCSNLRGLTIETNSPQTEINMDGCLLAKDINFENWMRIIQLDLKLAKFGPLKISNTCLKMVESLTTKPTYSAMEKLDDDKKIYLCDDESTQFFDKMLSFKNRINIRQVVSREIQETLKIDSSFLSIEDRKDWGKLSDGEITDFYTRESVYEQYINYLKHSKKLKISTMSLYMQESNSSYRIWRINNSKGDGIQYDLSLINNPESSADEIYDFLYKKSDNETKASSLNQSLKIKPSLTKELLDAIGSTNSDNKKLTENIHVSRGEVESSISDFNNWYAADYINLILYYFGKKNAQIKIYPAASLEALHNYEQDILSQSEIYAFIPLNIAYDNKNPQRINHWVVLIIDKGNHLIFYIDPAQKTNIPKQVVTIKNKLNYEKEVIDNPIDFQQKEKKEGWIRHCGPYSIEIVICFLTYIQKGQCISGKFSPSLPIPNSVAVQTAFSTIPCGEADNIKQIRERHIELAHSALIENRKEFSRDDQSDNFKNPGDCFEDDPIIIPLKVCNVITIDNKLTYDDLKLICEVIYYFDIYQIKQLEIDKSFVKKISDYHIKTLITALNKNQNIQDFFVIENKKRYKNTRIDILNMLSQYLPMEETNSSSIEYSSSQNANQGDQIVKESEGMINEVNPTSSEEERTREYEHVIKTQQDTIAGKEQQIVEKDQEIKRKNQEIEEKKQQIKEKDQQIEEKNRQVTRLKGAQDYSKHTIKEIIIITDRIPEHYVKHEAAMPIPGTTNRQQHRIDMKNDGEKASKIGKEALDKLESGNIPSMIETSENSGKSLTK